MCFSIEKGKCSIKNINRAWPVYKTSRSLAWQLENLKLPCDWNLVNMVRQLCLLSVISISYYTVCHPCVYWCDIFLVYSHLQYLLKAQVKKTTNTQRERKEDRTTDTFTSIYLLMAKPQVHSLPLVFFQYTVPLKGKLTVSTRNLILYPLSFQESSFEVEFLFSRIENQVSRIEFQDTWRIFRVSWTEILRKRFNSWKQNNRDEQNNLCTASFIHTHPLWMYANIFSCCAWVHAAHLSTLKLITRWQQN